MQWSSMSFRKRFIVVMIGISMIPLVVVTAISGYSMQKVSHAKVVAQLESVREAKHSQLSDYFRQLSNHVLSLSQDPMVIEAMKGFSLSFTLLPEDSESNIAATKIRRDQLLRYYANDFPAEFKRRNDHSKMTSIKLPKDEQTLAAQSLYLAPSRGPLEGKATLTTINHNSAYGKLHGRIHPNMQNILQRFDYDDIYLVDARSGYVVYSVVKALDFATNLKNGPYKDTNIAQVFRDAVAAGKAGSVQFADFRSYLPAFNSMSSFISSPIYDGPELVGVLIFKTPVRRINEIMQAGLGVGRNLGQTGKSYLVGSDAFMRSQSRFSKENTIGKTVVASAALSDALAGNSAVTQVDDYRGVAVLTAYAPLNIFGMKWALLTEIDAAEAAASGRRLALIIMGIALILAIFMLVSIFYLAHKIYSQLGADPADISELAEQIAAGDLTQEAGIEVTSRSGVYRAILIMKDKLITVLNEVESHSSTLSNAAAGVSAASKSLSLAVSQQATEVEHTGASVEKMSASINLNNVSSKFSDAVALKLALSATQGSEAMTRSVTAMNNIVEKTSAIEEIAYETHLLALNAVIEAARAGEHGKGFVEAATALRKLAERSRHAASEIGELASRSVELVGRAGKLIDGVVPHINQAADLVQEISAASDEQAHAVTHFTNAISTLDGITRQNVDASEKLSATANELQKQSARLSEKVQFFSVPGTVYNDTTSPDMADSVDFDVFGEAYAQTAG